MVHFGNGPAIVVDYVTPNNMVWFIGCIVFIIRAMSFVGCENISRNLGGLIRAKYTINVNGVYLVTFGDLEQYQVVLKMFLLRVVLSTGGRRIWMVCVIYFFVCGEHSFVWCGVYISCVRAVCGYTIIQKSN